MTTTTNKISIWSPRYHDRKVLIAKYKVQTNNVIEFTKAKHLKGMKFEMSGADIASNPIESNGKLPCYAVDLDELLENKVKE